jgi:hypothetical protein
MFKTIIATLAGLAIAAPVSAKIENGTKPLIDLIDSAGIAVLVNNADCADEKYLGLFRHRGMKRAFILCPGETVNAADHMVVRHEAIHVIQHCVNVARGTHVLTPIVQDEEVLMTFARQYLGEERLNWIKRNYERSHWLIEFEAFAGMHAYTSDELAEMFTKACLYTDA